MPISNQLSKLQKRSCEKCINEKVMGENFFYRGQMFSAYNFFWVNYLALFSTFSYVHIECLQQQKCLLFLSLFANFEAKHAPNRFKNV